MAGSVIKYDLFARANGGLGGNWSQGSLSEGPAAIASQEVVPYNNGTRWGNSDEFWQGSDIEGTLAGAGHQIQTKVHVEPSAAPAQLVGPWGYWDAGNKFYLKLTYTAGTYKLFIDYWAGFSQTLTTGVTLGSAPAYIKTTWDPSTTTLRSYHSNNGLTWTLAETVVIALYGVTNPMAYGFTVNAYGYTLAGYPTSPTRVQGWAVTTLDYDGPFPGTALPYRWFCVMT